MQWFSFGEICFYFFICDFNINVQSKKNINRMQQNGGFVFVIAKLRRKSMWRKSAESISQNIVSWKLWSVIKFRIILSYQSMNIFISFCTCNKKEIKSFLLVCVEKVGFRSNNREQNSLAYKYSLHKINLRNIKNNINKNN